MGSGNGESSEKGRRRNGVRGNGPAQTSLQGNSVEPEPLSHMELARYATRERQRKSASTDTSATERTEDIRTLAQRLGIPANDSRIAAGDDVLERLLMLYDNRLQQGKTRAFSHVAAPAHPEGATSGTESQSTQPAETRGAEAIRVSKYESHRKEIENALRTIKGLIPPELRGNTPGTETQRESSGSHEKADALLDRFCEWLVGAMMIHRGAGDRKGFHWGGQGSFAILAKKVQDDKQTDVVVGFRPPFVPQAKGLGIDQASLSIVRIDTCVGFLSSLLKVGRDVSMLQKWGTWRDLPESDLVFGHQKVRDANIEGSAIVVAGLDRDTMLDFVKYFDRPKSAIGKVEQVLRHDMRQLMLLKQYEAQFVLYQEILSEQLGNLEASFTHNASSIAELRSRMQLERAKMIPSLVGDARKELEAVISGLRADISRSERDQAHITTQREAKKRQLTIMQHNLLSIRDIILERIAAITKNESQRFLTSMPAYQASLIELLEKNRATDANRPFPQITPQRTEAFIRFLESMRVERGDVTFDVKIPEDIDDLHAAAAEQNVFSWQSIYTYRPTDSVHLNLMTLLTNIEENTLSDGTKVVRRPLLEKAVKFGGVSGGPEDRRIKKPMGQARLSDALAFQREVEALSQSVSAAPLISHEEVARALEYRRRLKYAAEAATGRLEARKPLVDEDTATQRADFEAPPDDYEYRGPQEEVIDPELERLRARKREISDELSTLRERVAALRGDV